jgi:pSer/pThr/pTyr-binding forkhead associated (FHA) protein
VDGARVYQLKQSVINIGRRLGNHLVIDDPRVSRSHAQLRAINGRFVLFDLDSTGGTFINGQRRHQSILHPGDVISLSGVPLIFGQDNPADSSYLTDTSPIASARSSSRPQMKDPEGEEENLQ